MTENTSNSRFGHKPENQHTRTSNSQNDTRQGGEVDQHDVLVSSRNGSLRDGERRSLTVSAPSTASLRTLCERVLEGLGAPSMPAQTPTSSMRRAMFESMRVAGVETLVIDEAQHLLAGALRMQPRVLGDWLREISDAGINVRVTSPKSTKGLLDANAQLARRAAPHQE